MANKSSSDYRAGYSAGYATKGRGRSQERFDRFYAAAMTGLLAGVSPWQAGGKQDSSAKDYAVTARTIATAMIKESP
jgi:hypothetical protein